MEEESWDADDFQIPEVKKEVLANNGASSALKKENHNVVDSEIPRETKEQTSSQTAKPIGRKQRLKAALRSADSKGPSQSREDKVATLQDLMGVSLSHPSRNGKHQEWLDPHCNESQFTKKEAK